MGEGLSVEEATVRQLQSLLQAQHNLRRTAEKRAREAMSALERVAEGLAPAELDRLRRESTSGISTLAPRQIADLVLNVVRRRLSRLESVVGVDPEELEALRAEVVELRRQAQRRTAAPAPLPQPAPPPQPEKSERQIEPQPVEPESAAPAPAAIPTPASGSASGRPPWMLLASPAPVQPSTPFKVWPSWAQRWREESKSLSRDIDVIIVLGDTGVATRDDVDEFLSEWWGISSGSGSINRGINRVREAGLVEAIATRHDKGRYPRHLLHLTERGRDIYRLLRGRDPALSLTTELMKRHKSPEHAMLNLDTAVLLWSSGYVTELFPDKVGTERGTYYPDLAIMAPEGQRLFVECERDTRKNREERNRKWELYYAASGGHFLVVTPTEEARATIRAEIEAWAGEKLLTLWTASVAGKDRIEWDYQG